MEFLISYVRICFLKLHSELASVRVFPQSGRTITSEVQEYVSSRKLVPEQFYVERGRLEEFQAFLTERVATNIREGGIRPSLYLDGAMKPAAATLSLVRDLQRVGPFGSGNPEPRFVIPAAQLSYAAVVGERHVRGFVTGEGGGRLAAISFNCVDSPLGQALLNSDGAPLHLAGRLKVNTWQGRSSAQLHIDDAAPAW